MTAEIPTVKRTRLLLSFAAAVYCIFAMHGAAYAQRTNIALGKVTAASATEGTLNSSYVVDNDTNTRWSSYANHTHDYLAYDTEWIYVNLGSSFTVDSINLAWDAASATTYDVQYSNLATVPGVDSLWKKCFTVSGRDTINDKWQKMPIKLATPVVAHFVRVKAYKPITFSYNNAPIHYGYSMREFRVFAYDSAKITASPFDLIAAANQPAVFTVAARGFPAPSYQWQKSIDSGKTFANVTAGSGATTPSYSFTTATADSGAQFRCLVSNALDTAISAAAILNVVPCTILQIAIDPPAAQSVVAGSAVQLNVNINPDATNPKFQWQRSNDNGVNFANVTAGTGGTTTQYGLTAAQADNGAKFRCIVYNLCSKDTSIVSSLAVCTPASISAQPKDTLIRVGQSALFGVTAAGTPLTYQWQKSPAGPTDSWTPVAGATAATCTYPVTMADTNGAKFRCLIHGQSPCGDTVTRAALMTVCVSCSLTAQSVSNLSVLAGTSVSYSVTAIGSSVTYQWQRRLPGKTTWDTITGARTGSYSLTAAYSDSGTAFRCVASGTCGSATSAAGVLTVYAPVKAKIWTRDTLGPLPLSVALFDSSRGSYSKIQWSFGDTGKVDTVTKNPLHVYSGIGTFTVRLVVSGHGGTDTAYRTILTWAAGTNPMQMTGRYLQLTAAGDTQKAEIIIKNYNAISPSSPLVVLDSIGLWYKNAKIPTRPDSAVYRRTYSLSGLKARGDQYVDTVGVPTLKTDSYCGFVTGIFWSDQKGKPTPFSNGNGALVLMRDTVPPANDLTLSGAYLPRDTARLSIGNISSIDTTRVDSIFVWYGLTNDSANFNDRNFTTGLSMVKDVYKSLSNNQYQFSAVNQAFFADQKTVYFAVMVCGKNDRRSPVKKCSFSVGVPRPPNPIKLRAKALSATRIRVSWNDISTAAVERILIWYRAGRMVDTVADVSALKLDSLVPARLSDTVVIGTNFNQTTHYYFGAQVFKGGLWSQITTGASAGDSTPAAGAPLDSATVKALNLKIAGPVFDTATNTIKIGWTVNRNAVDSLDIGISYSTVSASADTVIGQASPSTGATDSATVKLREDLLYNTEYYVKVWLRRPGGAWTNPGQSSGGVVTTPTFTWQSVTYFTKENDSVYAFNREIRLLNQPGDLSTTANIVRYVTVPALAIKGLVRVSTGFDFKVKTRGTPFLVGLKIDSLPAGYALSDVRVYQDSAGYIKLIRDSLVFDPLGGYVSVLTSDLDFPFFAMVDKTGPTHVTLSNPDAAVAASKPVKDTVIVHDNIANLNWRLLSARGAEVFDTIARKVHGMCDDTTETLLVTIDSSFLTQDNGARVLLIIDDGIHYDTVNLSRRVLRDASDLGVTEALKWAPLFVTADLDTPDARAVFRTLSADSANWKYDNTRFRVFRCLPNSQSTKGWEWREYADSIRAMFDFTPGTIEWVKSKERDTLHYGKSTTVSLKVPKEFRIAPRSWIDFAVPYKFNVTVGDIISASRGGAPAAGGADSLEFYSWKKDSQTSAYITDLVFMNEMPGASVNSLATPLSPDVAGYAVFNPLFDSVVLRIPPLPVALSLQGLQKHASVKGWAVKVAGSQDDRTPLGAVFCAYSPDRQGATSFYPPAPSFGSTWAGVADDSGKTVHGHAVAHSMAGGGCAFRIAFVNEGSELRRISYHLEGLAALPQPLKAVVYDAAGRFENFSNGDAGVSVAPGAREFRWLLVGDPGYLAKAPVVNAATLRLVGTYPNPVKSFLRIRYSLPREGLKMVRFEICDVSGRTVWHRELNCFPGSGIYDLVWNGTGRNGKPLASGIYLLRMTALDQRLKQAGTFERKITLMP